MQALAERRLTPDSGGPLAVRPPLLPAPAGRWREGPQRPAQPVNSARCELAGADGRATRALAALWPAGHGGGAPGGGSPPHPQLARRL